MNPAAIKLVADVVTLARLAASAGLAVAEVKAVFMAAGTMSDEEFERLLDENQQSIDRNAST